LVEIDYDYVDSDVGLIGQLRAGKRRPERLLRVITHNVMILL
jgi:hypothetical protein